MTTTLQYLDPTTLTVGANVRADTRLDPEFLASIKERGVLQAVSAHRSADGSVVVDQGQRRTLAAAQLGILSIPVIVDGQEPKEADRLVDQWVENEHRAGLSNRERIQAIEQMALVGLTAGQIAKRTATSKADVAAARAAAGSQTAVDHADELTLEDAAILAEFEDDAQAVDQLLQEAHWGRGLAARAERIRNDREELRMLTAAGAALADRGLTVIEPPAWEDKTTLELDRLRDGRKRIDPEKHATSCPGHVVWVRRGYGTWGDDGKRAPASVETVAGCTGWPKHGHTDSHGSATAAAKGSDDPAVQAAARAERRHVIESNKNWKAATTVRRRWLAAFLQRKTAPDGAEALLAAAVVGGWRSEVSPYAGASGALELLGTTRDALAGELATASPKRALQIALAVTVASWEAGTTDDTWRASYGQEASTRVLAAISQWGHQLSEIEARIVDGTATQPQATAA